MDIFLSAFAPEQMVSRDGSAVPSRVSLLISTHIQAEHGVYLWDSSRVNRDNAASGMAVPDLLLYFISDVADIKDLVLPPFPLHSRPIPSCFRPRPRPHLRYCSCIRPRSRSHLVFVHGSPPPFPSPPRPPSRFYRVCMCVYVCVCVYVCIY